MKHYEIYAYNIEDAKKLAYEKYGAIVIRDYTKCWHRVKTKDSKPVPFLIEKMVEDEIFGTPDAAAIVQVHHVHNAVRFYSPIEIIKRKGHVKLKRQYEICSLETDKILAIAPNKGEAIKMAKRIMPLYQEDMYGRTRYVAEDKSFILRYSPPNKAKLGNYIVVKTEEDDLNCFTRKFREMW